MITLPGEIKSWLVINKEGEKLQWLMYYQLISRLKEAKYTQTHRLQDLTELENASLYKKVL